MIPNTRPEDGQRPQEQRSAADFPSTLDSRAKQSGEEPRTAPMLELPGYELLSELGRGGMGVVYKARTVKDHRLVAIKMLRDGVLADAKHLARFHSEALTLSSLEHPNFLKIYEIGDFQGRPFLALQFAEGGNLADRIGPALPAPAETARLIETLAQAMQYAHDRGIVHRDLKPANILLDCRPSAVGDRSEETQSILADLFGSTAAGRQPAAVLIADFGLVKHAEFQGMTHTGDLLGTPSYMAPEQAEARHDDVGPATDIYALGTILYELLTGQPPFKGLTTFATLEQVRFQKPVPPRRLKPGVPPDLEAICLKCLRKEPRKRYDSMSRLAAELHHFLTGQPLQHTESLGQVDRQTRRLVQRAVARGRQALDRGELLMSLPWFVKALYLDQGHRRAERIHRLRLASVVQRCPRLLRMWFLSGPIVRAVCAPAGPFAAVLGEDNTVRVLDLSGSGTPRVLRHTGGVQCLAFRRDGQRLVTGSDDGTARLWDTTTGELTLPLLVHGQWITHASFSNDGRLLVTGGMDGSAHVWEVATGLAVCRLAERTALVWSAAFSEDGSRVVTAGLDGVTRAWNVVTGAPVGPPLKHGAPVRHASRGRTRASRRTRRAPAAHTRRPPRAALRRAGRGVPVGWGTVPAGPAASRGCSGGRDHPTECGNANRFGNPERVGCGQQRRLPGCDPDARRRVVPLGYQVARAGDAALASACSSPRGAL
jgi:serine/threonine protein kinase